jgi:hypothetical protein
VSPTAHRSVKPEHVEHVRVRPQVTPCCEHHRAATGIVVLIIPIFTRASKAKPAGAGPRMVLMGVVESSAAGVGSW